MKNKLYEQKLLPFTPGSKISKYVRDILYSGVSLSMDLRGRKYGEKFTE